MVFAAAWSAHAAELSKANSPGLAVRGSPQTAAVSPSARQLYAKCALYPEPGTCEAVYQAAMRDDSVLAEAPRAEYAFYARYLTGQGTLTEQDLQFLKDNAIVLPDGLSGADLAGLHNVIRDESLKPGAKRAAVNNFLSRAVQAELYCGFNSCAQGRAESQTSLSQGGQHES
jgi:hypothetical protein